MRLTAKPGLFFAVIDTLPILFENASALAWVSSEVCKPRINSNSAISGTGLKKCIPMKRSGRSVAAASLVIEVDEVLVASSACGRRFVQRSFRILTCKSSFSLDASFLRTQLQEVAAYGLV